MNQDELFRHLFREMRDQYVQEAGAENVLPTMVRYDWFDDQYRCIGCGHELEHDKKKGVQDYRVYEIAQAHLAECAAIVGLANRTAARMIQKSDPYMIEMIRMFPEEMNKILNEMKQKLEVTP